PVKDEWDGQFAIAALEGYGVEITHHTTFASAGDGRDVWQSFAKDGRLSDSDVNWISSGEDLAGAIGVPVTLQPGEKKTVTKVIAWTLPVVEFGAGRKWFRHFTDFYGTAGDTAWKIAKDGLLSASKWSDSIAAWQSPYINDESKPLWYRGMLFNELYII